MALSDAAGLLSLALPRVLAGQMRPEIATAAATVSRALVAVRQAADIENRLGVVEAAVGIEEQRR